jgi:superfamily II DNA or RNA helicase
LYTGSLALKPNTSEFQILKKMASKHSQAQYLICKGIFDSIKSFKEFEIKVSALFETNTKAQGDAFEIFVEAYLLTQPITQCAETWLVGSIPVEVREELNLPNDSKGIDGVFKSTNDVLVPYQVKFRSNRPALGFNEVAPFLGITEKAVDRLLITNCDSIAIDVKNRTGIRSLRGVDFDLLTEDDFTGIENWLKAKPTKRAQLVPDPYQVEALSNISNHLQSNDRGSVVMACGTGKTLVALWAVEQSKAKSILVLLPSLTLLQQTLSEWSAHNSWGKNFSYLCVCSDPQVDLKNDEIELDITDVPFKIDTDPEIVKRYLAQENGKIKIIFSTYQSSQVVGEATKEGYTFEIGVFDEAHKTTGVSEGRFALALKDENISIKKRLFFTATPKHYDIRKRNKDGEFKFFSMDDESVYGSRAHTLSFSQAAEQGIICPYKVVVTLIDKQQVDDFALKNGVTLIEGDAVKAKWVASQVAVSSAIKHTNAKKIITFHSRVKTAREFASDEIYGIKKFLPNFDVFHVHGKQRSNERKDTIYKFKSSPSSLITNAKCLTEGVDVPAVDMVAFVDPRHSKIDIAQAVGRAMRKPRGGDKQLGYIVVPLYAECTDEQSLETAIKNEGFDDVALIINSLLEQDSELAEIISELMQAKGRGEVFNPTTLKDKIEVIGPYVNLGQLQSSIFVETLDRLGSTWDEMYGQLQKYSNIYGDCSIPKNHKPNGDSNLGKWVSRQRSNRNFLSSNRKLLLESLKGWSWDPYEDAWNLGFKQLCDFLEKNRNFLIQQTFLLENGFAIGEWVSTQRIAYKNKTLSNERKFLLESLNGWSWDPIDDAWKLAFNYLRDYSNNKGDCLVPKDLVLENGFILGNWIQNQRQQKNSNTLSNDRKLLLESLKGWSWDPHEDAWKLAFNYLRSYSDKYGDCVVPRDLVLENGFGLGIWVSNQRRQKNINKLLIERKLLLESLKGWSWDPHEDAWNLGYNYLSDYSNNKGDCLVPKDLVLENGYALGSWVSYQRQQQKKLSTEKKLRLNSLRGWSWDPRDDAWNLAFNYLSNYSKNKGDCLVPKDLVLENGCGLKNWIRKQRAKKDKLTFEKIKLLESLTGWKW